MADHALGYNISIEIPNIIWQTGKDDYESLEYPYNLNANTWQTINPNWEYRYANEEQKRNDIYNYGDQDFIELSKYLEGAFLADLWRYIMLYQHGGVYSDLDSINALSLDILPYNITSRKCETIVSNDGGYTNFGPAVYNYSSKVRPCLPCLEFTEIIKTGVYGQDQWMNNNGFAAIPRSKPLEYVLDEVRRRFNIFKETHGNKIQGSHEIINHVVDCSAFEVGVTKDESLISRTFIYSVQSHGNNNGKKLFKDYFTDVYSYTTSNVFFLDNTKEETK
jgi:hypothetical protein